MPHPARFAAPLALTAALLTACASHHTNHAASPSATTPASASNSARAQPECRLIHQHTTLQHLGTPTTVRVREVEYFRFGEGARTSIRFRYNPWDWNDPCAPSTVVAEMVNADPKIEFDGTCPGNSDANNSAVFILHITLRNEQP